MITFRSLKKNCYFSLIFFIIILTMSSCISKKNIQTPPNFFKDKKSIAVLWLCDKDQKTLLFYKIGQQFLVDRLATEYFIKDIKNKLYSIDLEPLIKKNYLDLYQKALLLKKFNVKVSDKPYFSNKLSRIKTIKEHLISFFETFMYYGHKIMLAHDYSPPHPKIYDFKQIGKDLNVDYLMVMDVMALGVARQYARFIPSTSPKGYTIIFTYIVDAKTNNIIAQHYSCKYETPSGKWNEPPEYENIINSVYLSLEKSINESFYTIFKKLP